VHPVILDATGTATRTERRIARAKCSACRYGFTSYSDELYPRRQYQLDVVARVVAEIAVGHASAPAAARELGASPTSARRWTKWIAEIAETSELLRVTRHLDPAAPAGGGLSLHAGAGVRHRAACVLDALEQLGAALVRRGVALVQRSGLGRVLGWQRALFGDVVNLVTEPKTLSPAMALGGAPSGL
jgi:transposase-like protein